jgi:hypothetical protein
MLRSGGPACGLISLLAHESGLPQRRPESALLFSGWAKKGLTDNEALFQGFECFEGMYAEFKRS